MSDSENEKEQSIGEERKMVHGTRILYNLFVHDNEWAVDVQEQNENSLPEPAVVKTSNAEDGDDDSMHSFPTRSQSRVGSVISAVSGLGVVKYTGRVLSSVGRIFRPMTVNIPQSFRQFKMNSLPWQVFLSPSSSCLAILGCDSSMKESHISFRDSKEEFSTDNIVWRGPMDSLSSWRCGAWAPASENSDPNDEGNEVFAACTSSSEITVLSSTGKVLKSFGPDSLSAPIRLGIAGLALVWENAVDLVLIIVDFGCQIFKVKISDQKTNVEMPLDVSKYHNGCITSCAFDHDNSTLMLTGMPHSRRDDESTNSDEGSMDVSKLYSLSMWQVRDKSPYWTRKYSNYMFPRDVSSENVTSMTDTQETEKEAKIHPERLWKSITRMILGGSHKGTQVVAKCTLSPNSSLMALLLVSGSVHVWNLNTSVLVDIFLSEDDQKVVSVGWWSDSALIVSKENGEVSILSLPDWKNILGSSPELAQPGAVVTSAINGHLFILEREIWHEGDREVHTKSEKTDSAVWKQAVRHIDKAFYLWTPGGDLNETDLDADWPLKSKQERRHATFYRLLSLSETTPHALFQSKVELSDFEGALKIGNAFGLNTDPVYQSQWQNAEISTESITNYLKNVKSKAWVITQTLTRVAPNADAMRLLLEYGLSLCNPDRASELISSTDHYSVRQLMIEEMTSEERELIKKRISLLRYIDRLEIFMKIHRGVYEIDAFLDFRDMDLIEIAVSAAVSEDFETLQVLLSVPGVAVFPARFAILSCVPETAFVGGYAQLMPYATENGDEKVVSRHLERDEDWTDDAEFVYKVFEGTKVTADGSLVTMSLPKHLTSSTAASKQTLTGFYRQRAREMDRRAGMVDNSLALIDHGISVGVQDLEDLRSDLVELCSLVYESGDISVTLDEYEGMPQHKRMELFLDGSDDIAATIKSRLLPLLNERKNVSKRDLIMNYVKGKASDGDLSKVVQLIESGRSDLYESKHTIFSDFSELVHCSLSAVYACTEGDTKTLSMMQTILDCLPSGQDYNDTKEIESEDIVVDDKVPKEQQEKIALFKEHLAASVLLGNYDIDVPVKFFVNVNPSSSKVLVESMIQHVTRMNRRKATDKVWKALLSDIRKLQKSLLSCVPLPSCYEMYLRHLLSAGRFSYAAEVIRSGSHAQSHEALREVVLRVSREYFNSAADPDDDSMKAALSCLSVLEQGPEGADHPDVVFERNLADAVAAVREHGTDLLPVQIRLEHDKLNIIRAALKNSPILYKDPDGAVTISRLLGLRGADDEVSVRVLAAGTACDRKDFDTAFRVSEPLIGREEGITEAWTVWKTLSLQPEVDIEMRQRCASLALLYGPENEQESLLESWNKLKIVPDRSKISSEWISAAGFYGNDFLFSYTESGTTDPSILRKLAVCGAEVGALLSNESSDSTGPALRVRWRKTLSEFVRSASMSHDASLVVSALCVLWEDSSPSQLKGLVKEWMETHGGTRASGLVSLLGAYALSLGSFSSSDLRLSSIMASPLELIRFMIIATDFDKSSLESPVADWYEQIKEAKELVSEYVERVRESQHAQAFEVLHSTVDAKKFSTDQEYRQSVLESLPRRAGHGQVHGLLTAIKLARRVGVEAWQIVVSHLVWYITTSKEDIIAGTESRLSLPSVKETLEDGGIKATVALKNESYPKIDGSNYQQMMALFNCMMVCTGRAGHRRGRSIVKKRAEQLNSATANAKKMIEKLPTDCILDVKAILNGTKSLENRLGEIISAENITVLTNIAEHIPIDGPVLSESEMKEDEISVDETTKYALKEHVIKIYCFKVLDEMFQDEKTETKLNLWGRIIQYFTQMKPEDANEFVLRLVNWISKGRSNLYETGSAILDEISRLELDNAEEMKQFAHKKAKLLQELQFILNSVDSSLQDSVWEHSKCIIEGESPQPFAHFAWCSVLPTSVLQSSCRVLSLMTNQPVEKEEIAIDATMNILEILSQNEPDPDTPPADLILSETGSVRVNFPPKTFRDAEQCLKTLHMAVKLNNGTGLLPRFVNTLIDHANPKKDSTTDSMRISILSILQESGYTLSKEQEKWFLWAKSCRLLSLAEFDTKLEWIQFGEWKEIIHSLASAASCSKQYSALGDLLDTWSNSSVLDDLGECWFEVVSHAVESDPDRFDYSKWWNRSSVHLSESNGKKTLEKFENLLGSKARIECSIMSEHSSIRESAIEQLLDTNIVFEAEFYALLCRVRSAPITLVNTVHFSPISNVIVQPNFPVKIFRSILLDLHESGHLAQSSYLIAKRYLPETNGAICIQDIRKLYDKVLDICRREQNINT